MEALKHKTCLQTTFCATIKALLPTARFVSNSLLHSALKIVLSNTGNNLSEALLLPSDPAFLLHWFSTSCTLMIIEASPCVQALMVVLDKTDKDIVWASKLGGLGDATYVHSTDTIFTACLMTSYTFSIP